MKKKIILAVSMILLCVISLFAVGKFRNAINADTNKVSKIEEKKESTKDDNIKDNKKNVDETKKKENSTKETDSKNKNEEKQNENVSKENSKEVDTQKKDNASTQTVNQQKDSSATPVNENKPKENIALNNDKKAEKKPNLIVIDEINNKIIVSIKVEFNGEDAAKATMRALDESGVKYRATTMADNTYFSSIGGLKERAEGPASGWCYYVNGEKPSVSAGAYKLKNEDVIEWKYLKDGIK